MALTQMQIIQSLGEAMTWFERELAWGVPATELRHLCGRIGELYAAMITNGQMATSVNQHGYDVVSGHGERISVKTTATLEGRGQVLFNPRTLDQVDRVMILRVNTEEMQVEILHDASTEDTLALMSAESQGKRAIPLYRLLKAARPQQELVTVREVTYLGYTVEELESGSILVTHNGAAVSPAKPALRDIAHALAIPVINSNGNQLNTRQLGNQVIQGVRTLRGEPVLRPSLPEDDL